MIRTVIAIDDDDKDWLDARAASEGTSMTEVVRRAIKHYRNATTTTSFDAVLERACGIWSQGDGLAWQNALRDEWSHRDP